jgi:hypothetical protein
MGIQRPVVAAEAFEQDERSGAMTEAQQLIQGVLNALHVSTTTEDNGIHDGFGLLGSVLAERLHLPD